MKSYLYLNELTPAQLKQVGREIEQMHKQSTENIKRAVAALRSLRGEKDDSTRNIQDYSS